ncbi:MAG: WecB/TagA/CpsF family glycosyltransferase [Labilithrix sp.]|nr:WecB/TagA/CpsF family glycosyltransferase [Labilithrix sp.]MCW5815329.1 WecB/TagA/CpsF family glycosyltransferase [Labilithrix sp.]
MSERIDLLGCPFDAITEDATVDLVFRWIEDPERKSHHIITVNVAILMMAKEDPKLADAIDKADLVVVDGKPLVWTSKWLGAPVPHKVSGVDLMRRLLEEGDRRGLRIFLLGTTQERLDVLVKVIEARYPGVTIAGARNGYFKAPDYPAVTETIRESKADLLLVGMPAPFKEIWCEEHRDAIATPCMLGVGGAFDVMAGFVPRAPRLMQEAGMEWAWRLAMEPKKLWKRYLVTNSAFLALLGKTLVLRRAGGAVNRR